MWSTWNVVTICSLLLLTLSLLLGLIKHKGDKKKKFVFNIVDNNRYELKLDFRFLKDQELIEKSKNHEFLVITFTDSYAIFNEELKSVEFQENIGKIDNKYQLIKNDYSWHKLNDTFFIYKWYDHIKDLFSKKTIECTALLLSIITVCCGFYYYGEQISYQTKKTQWDNYITLNRIYQDLFIKLENIDKNKKPTLEEKKNWTRSYFNLWIDEYRLHKENLIPPNMLSDLINNSAIINICNHSWIKDNYKYWLKEGAFSNFDTENNRDLENSSIIKFRQNIPFYRSWAYSDNDIKMQILENKNDFKNYIEKVFDDIEKHPSCIGVKNKSKTKEK
jgi:hypothetical protein